LSAKKYDERSKVGFDEYVRNIYRMLMTRGMKGCYVYFTNKETEAYFGSRIKRGTTQ